MVDRTTQIAREWLAKCADVVLDARDDPGRQRVGGSGERVNRWFNAATRRRRETRERVEGKGVGGRGSFGDEGTGVYDDGLHGGGGGEGRVIAIDVRFERDGSEAEASALVERWTFHAGADAGSVGGNNHFNKDLETPVVYKRAVIMVRTLVALLRTLPAHGARIRAMRHAGATLGKESAGGRFRFDIRELASGTTVQDAHPGKQAGYKTYAFADVPTSVGKLCACVYFLDEPAVKALEEKFIGVIDSTPLRSLKSETLDASVGPDVELAGGEMSLSPSPTGKGGSDRMRRDTDLAEVSRGLTFGIDGTDDSTMQRENQPPVRGGVTASSSAGSLQQMMKPPTMPLADYMSPNFQRFDNAPSSAPSVGPAPIYGFNAAPSKSSASSKSPGTLDAPISGMPKPPIRAESCLKIDAGTSMDLADVAKFEQGPKTPVRATSVAMPTLTVGAETTPEQKMRSPMAGSTPIACSPANRHRGASAARAVPSPSWGGFACPESPSPSLGTSPGAHFAQRGSSYRRSSWSPSSSLGTSLRDVVGVYPHSPGGATAVAAAFARRMSGASDDATGGSPHFTDDGANEEDFPFDLDDADGSATYVEHTPADLLHLLENPLPLRRKSTDSPLPLDAALDEDETANDNAECVSNGANDDTRDACVSAEPRVAKFASADDASTLTLGSALDTLRELNIARDALGEPSV